MPELSTFAIFALATIAFLVVPGPSVVFIVTRSLEQGPRAGLASMAGVQTGALAHVAAAAVGLSALLASSAVAFSIVKYAGAAYLIWVGLRKLRSRGDAALEQPERATLRRLYREGFIVNLLNPKTAIFFLAFLPQFVVTDAPLAPQILVLGALFVALAALSDSTYALLAGKLGERLRRSVSFRRRMERISGSVYVGLGVMAARSTRSG